MMGSTDLPIIRFSLLKRHPQHTREGFSQYYENSHGPLAADLPGFRQYTTRYIQNHLELKETSDSQFEFDGVTMTTQVPREDYSKGFFTHPDYERVKEDEQYLFDVSQTVSLIGQQDVVLAGPSTHHKVLFLAHSDMADAFRWGGASRIHYNHLDTATASALGFSKGSFSYDRLIEVWFKSSIDRNEAVLHSREMGNDERYITLPVKELEIFGPKKPWTASQLSTSPHPKVFYFAKKIPGLSDAQFKVRWQAHGALAMSLPLWDNMWKYAQCDPLTLNAAVPPCDAVGLVWYKSLHAMDAIAKQPELRRKLLSDELETFASYIKDVAVLTSETVLLGGVETSYKLLILDKTPNGKLALPLPSAIIRHVRSDQVPNAYTQTSSIACKAVHELFFSDLTTLEQSAVYLRQHLPSSTPVGIIAAYERQMFGNFEHELSSKMI